MAESCLNLEDLLENKGWLKALALSLVSDDALADDIVQETWLAAMKSPPVPARAARSWLARVVRNLANGTRRARKRRIRREFVVAKKEDTSCTPEELLQRAELQRDIAEAIVALKEPYRSTILLRFFEELSVRAISLREETPITTVKSRLAKGLQQLRIRLDRSYGGDRQAWCSVLLLLVGLPTAVSSAAGSVGAGVVKANVTAVPAATIAKVASSSSVIGGIIMTQKALMAGAVLATLSLGGWLGYRYVQTQQHAASGTGDATRESAGSGASFRQATQGGVPTGRREPRRVDRRVARRGGDREHQPEDDNLFRGMSAVDLIAYLNRTWQNENPSRFHQAVEMLCACARRDPKGVLHLLSSIEQRDVMDNLMRALVSHGGEEGLKAVLDYITDSTKNMDMRREAIYGLERVSPEARALAQSGLNHLMTQHLPRELQIALCNVYGDVSDEMPKEEAFENLMRALNDPACLVRPEFLIERAGEVGTPENTRALLSLLGRTWTSREQEAILHAAARSSGSGEILLDLLEEPPDGVARETIAHAIDDAEWSSQHTQMLLDAIAEESHQEVRAELCRALGRSGGEGLDRLLDLAKKPDANIDLNSLAAGLADSPRPEFLATMTELLPQVKDRGTVHQLACSIAEAGGREGVDALLEIIAGEKISPDWFYLLSSGITRNGRPEHAARLFELLEGNPHPNGARALLKTAHELSGAAGTEHCLSLLRESANGDVRAVAAEVMGEHDPGRHLPELVDALGREEFERAQRNLASAIAGAGPDGMVQLGEMIRWDGNAERKYTILEVLVSDHLNEAVGVLREALARETDEQIRAKIAEAIEKAESG